MVDILQ